MHWETNRVDPRDADELIDILGALRIYYGYGTLLHLAVACLVSDTVGGHAAERVFVLGDYTVTVRKEP